MDLTIKGYISAKYVQVRDAAAQEWLFDDWYESFSETTWCLTASGCGSLCGGESEEEFAKQVTEAIWKANGKYCEVEVVATYMEDLPYTTHSLGLAAYKQFNRTLKKPVKKSAKKKPMKKRKK
jgi:hypothetical protein